MKNMLLFLCLAVLPGWRIFAIPVEQPMIAVQSVQSGDWNNPATWSSGMVPGTNDEVTILSGHTILVNGGAAAGNVTVIGALRIEEADTLLLGNSGGGRHRLVVQGRLEISSGLLFVAGSLDLASGSQFVMTGGTIKVDGNDGTTEGSVAAGTDLVRFSAGMTVFEFTGGCLHLVDPPHEKTGAVINSAYDFGTGSMLKLGDSTGTNAGSELYAFGKNLPDEIGNLEVYLDDNLFKLYRPLRIRGDCRIGGPYWIPDYIFGQAAFHTQDSLTIMGNLSVGNSMTIGSVDTFMRTGFLRVLGNMVIDEGKEVQTIYTSKMSVNGNLIVNGGLRAENVYMSYDYEKIPSTHLQLIGGSVEFWRLSISQLFINNSSTGGVRLDSAFGLHENFVFRLTAMHFIQGLFYAGNKNIFLGWDIYGSGPGKYVVLDTGGRITGKSDLTGAIGADSLSFNPIFIDGTANQQFEIGIKKSDLSQPGTSGINREWRINVLQDAGLPYTLKLQWNSDQEEPNFHRTHCYLSSNTGSGWNAVSSTLPAQGSDPYFRTIPEVTGTGWFTIRSNDILPVRLSGFHAEIKGSAVVLRWQAEDLGGFSHFDIERSVEGSSFAFLDRVAAHGGAGRVTYSYVDHAAPAGRVGYRLRMVDRDGSFEYSPVLWMDLRAPAEMIIYPNPVEHTLYITGPDGYSQLRITDRTGNTVMTRQIRLSHQAIDISRLPAGHYLITVEGSGKRVTRAFVKQ